MATEGIFGFLTCARKRAFIVNTGNMGVNYITGSFAQKRKDMDGNFVGIGASISKRMMRWNKVLMMIQDATAYYATSIKLQTRKHPATGAFYIIPC